MADTTDIGKTQFFFQSQSIYFKSTSTLVVAYSKLKRDNKFDR